MSSQRLTRTLPGLAITFVVAVAIGTFVATTCAQESTLVPVSLSDLVETSAVAEFDQSAVLDSFDYDDGGAYDIKGNRVDTHAPAGVMGGHVHEQSEYMIEYKYSNMFMDGNRAGTTRLSALDALNFLGLPPAGFRATPVQMNMEMHMLHFMYGLTDDVTLYVMPMYMVNTMGHLRRMPGPPGDPDLRFSTKNEGLGDLPFGALWRIYDGCTDEVILNIGFSAPTGNISETTTAPSGGAMAQEFPYPMRLGSGTFDVRPGITYRSYFERGSFGAQFQADLPIGINYAGYREGGDYRVNLWYTHLIDRGKRLGLSFRVESRFLENWVGADADLDPTLISTNRPDFRGGEWVNFGYGAMWQLPDGSRLSFEMVQPIYQNLRGVQLETDWQLFASWSKAF